METYNFIIILIIILIFIKLFIHRENFDECAIYGDNYNQCYNSGNCTVMIDLKGNSFCTNKFV